MSSEMEAEKKYYIKRSTMLLMLPHSNIWTMFVCEMCVLHIIIIIFLETYTTSDIQWQIEFIHYVLEFIYFTSIFFNITHRNYSIHKADICTRMMPFFILFLGVFSLIPFYEMYLLLLFGTPTRKLNLFFKLKVLLRLPQIYTFFYYRTREAGLNQVLYVFLFDVNIVLLYVTAISALLSYLGCYKCAKRNWTIHLKDAYYNHKNLLDRAFIPFTFLGNIVFSSFASILKPETVTELILISSTMFLSFMITSMIVIARLVAQAIMKLKKQSTFKNYLHNIYYFIEFQNFDKDLKECIRDYYNVLWHKRQAVTTLPKSFYLLPLSLQKDIMLDIFWDVLKHSHIFRNISLTFKRDICMHMQSEFRLPGDFIYEPKDSKYKLIYIASGIVQLLSEEDEESPVISFSSGTIISEMSCLMLTRSDWRLRCATYCELRTLSLDDFARFLSKNRHRTIYCIKSLKHRIQHARYVQQNKIKAYGMKYIDRPLKRIKTQWRNLANGVIQPVGTQSTSKNLDLIVLCDEMDLKMDVVCLTSSFPFILNPDSSFRNVCDVLCLVVLQTIIIPYFGAFERKVNSSIRTFLLFLDLVYFFDILVQLTTAIKDRDHFRTKFTDILLAKAKQLTFQVDILATLPIEYIAMIRNVSDQVFILLKFLRILKIYKVNELVKRFEYRLGSNILFIKIIKWILLYSIILYLVTCFLYITSCFYPKCFKTSWYAQCTTNRQDSAIYKSIHPSILTIWVAVSVLERAGTATIYTPVAADTLFMYLVFGISYFKFVITISDLTATNYWQMLDERSYKMLFHSVMKYARIHKLPRKLLCRIENMLSFRWNYNRDEIKSNAMDIFKDLPTKLREKVVYEMVVKYLQRTKLFGTADESLIYRIASICEVISYPPTAYMVINDRLISHLYIIKRGYCSLESFVPGDKENNTNLKMIGTGACFPVVEVMHRVQCFITVRCVTSVDAIAIPYHAMINYCKMDRKFFYPLEKTIEQHMQENRPTLNRAEGGMKFTLAVHPQEYGDLFEYQRPDSKSDNLNNEVKQKFNIWTHTCNPYTKWYAIYEIFRCTLAIIQFILIILYANVLYNIRETVKIANGFLDALCWCDMLIKTKLQYYNQHGALVQNVQYTVRNYVHTSFYLDLWASFPFDMFRIHNIFSPNANFHIKAFMLLVSRPFQLNRLLQGISYICLKHKVSEINEMRILIAIKIIIIFTLSGCALMVSFCTYQEKGYYCPPARWKNMELDPNSNWGIILYIYISTNYYTQFYSYVPTRPSINSILVYMGLILSMIVIRWLFTSKLISNALHDEYTTSQLQNDRLNFKKFAKHESLNEQFYANTLQTNEYLTSNLEFFALDMAEKRFTPQLNEDLAYGLNKRAMRNTQLLCNAPEFLLRMISGRTHRVFYKKDGIIVRHNEVHDKIFIVKRGTVHILIANSLLASFSSGGVFGAFQRRGLIRQTTMARAALHAELLVIRNTDFFQCIAMHTNTNVRINQFIRLNGEFSLPSRSKEEQFQASALNERELQSQTYLKYQQFVNKRINQNSRSYLIYDYIMNVHLSIISVIYVLIYQLFSMFPPLTVHFKIILYLLDVLFMVKIFFGFTLCYVDELSGLLVKDYRRIIIRYLKTSFTIDLLSVLQPELYFSKVLTNEFHNALLTCNRLLRFTYLVRYYYYYKRNNLLTHHIRWIYLVYLFIVYIQVGTNLWSYIACYKTDVCKYISSYQNVNFVKSPTMLYSIVLAYTYTIDTTTLTGMRIVRETNLSQVLYAIFSKISTIFISAFICSGFAMIQVIDNVSLAEYTHQLNDIQSYFHNHDLSSEIYNRVNDYYLLLWKVRGGEQLPAIITNVPNYLREDIMSDIYSHHLSNHELFRNTHVDFIRQMMLHAKVSTFPHDYVIVEMDDVDYSMYFVHSGTVNVITREGHKSAEVCQIKKNGSFGQLQGLLARPHYFSYIARTYVEVVMLNKCDWGYLLKFFPASVQEIEAKLKKLYNVEESIL